MFNILKRKNKAEIIINDTDVNAYPEPIEVFVNSSEDKCGELYYKNGCFTYIISEKLFDDYEGSIRFYWAPVNNSASFFDTKEKAIAEIMAIIEPSS